VTAVLRNHTALIVEEDIGFLLWLGDLLTDAGYRTIPSSACRQATKFARELGVPIHLTVANLRMKGATSMLRALGAAHHNLKIIAIGAPESKGPVQVPATAILEKPRGSDIVSREDWIKRINRAVTDAPPLASAATSGRSS